MTDIEQKALALVNTVNAERSRPEWRYLERPKDTAAEALCRAIEQHEAFRQDVSDAVERWNIEYLLGDALRADMARFIIAKPDPLEEVIADYKRTKGGGEYATNKDMAAALRAALAARGLKIVEVGHD